MGEALDGGESVGPADFNEFTRNLIAGMPAAEAIVDPFEARQIGEEIRIPFDHSYHENGYIEFGKNYEVRRTVTSDYEVILAFREDTYKGEVYIQEFAENGGVGTRTHFFQDDVGNLQKFYSLPPWKGLLFSSPYFSRDIDTEEAGALQHIMADPEANPEAVLAFVALTPKEQNLLEKSRREIAAANAALHRDLENIAAAERAAWQDADKIFLD